MQWFATTERCCAAEGSSPLAGEEKQLMTAAAELSWGLPHRSHPSSPSDRSWPLQCIAQPSLRTE